MKSDKEYFLDLICSKIKNKNVHAKIKDEYEDHIDELCEELKTDGMASEDALAAAVLRMGNPAEIGEQLNKTHKPLIEFSIIFSTLAIMIIGILCNLYLSKMLSIDISIYKLFGIFGLFFAAYAIAFKLDYQKLQKFCPQLYILSIIILASAVLNNYSTERLPSSIRVVHFTFPILIISFSGIIKKIFLDKNDLASSVKYLITFVIMVIPAFLCILIPNLASALLICCTLFLIFIAMILNEKFICENKKSVLSKLILTPFSIFSLIFLYFVSKNNFMIHRLRALLPGEADKYGIGYNTYVMRNIISNSKPFGETFVNMDDKVFKPLQVLPDASGFQNFLAIISVFGWAIGAVILILFVFLIYRMFLTVNKIDDVFGFLIAFGCSALITVQFVLSVLIQATLLPVSASNYFPFITFDISFFAVNFITLMIIVNIYKSKDAFFAAEIF